jgi:hypothetical protein
MVPFIKCRDQEGAIRYHRYLPEKLLIFLNNRISFFYKIMINLFKCNLRLDIDTCKELLSKGDSKQMYLQERESVPSHAHLLQQASPCASGMPIQYHHFVVVAKNHRIL